MQTVVTNRVGSGILRALTSGLASLACLFMLAPTPVAAQAQPQAQAAGQIPLSGKARFATPYGDNPLAGKVAHVNGIELYYEIYGDGPVLLQLHGNDGNIESMAAQLDFFSRQFRVIGVDSRGHGKSGMGNAKLTYEQMAEDVNALLEQLHLKPVNVLGWSDGGNVGLLLARHHPDKVARLAIMGANLRPAGAQPWALAWVAKQRQEAVSKLAHHDTSQNWQRSLQLLDLLGTQPNIATSDLRKISAPTLVMSGDRDVIRLQHSMEIFENLPQAHLAIFPGATHFIPLEDSARFNQTVLRFFQLPFARPDTHDLFR